MAAISNTIPIDGKEYTWTSPTLEEIAQVEADLGGPLLIKANTIQGKIHLLTACLRENHPEVTPGLIGKAARGTDLDAVWDVIKVAVPLWELPKAPPEAGTKQPSDMPTKPGDGDQAKPDESA
ncbi:MAG TPA: hypothetical protein VMY87_06890 [Armatimonadota bacterium]|nr:hypothetical protein [Armatimonadota bacterium]